MQLDLTMAKDYENLFVSWCYQQSFKWINSKRNILANGETIMVITRGSNIDNEIVG